MCSRLPASVSCHLAGVGFGEAPAFKSFLPLQITSHHIPISNRNITHWFIKLDIVPIIVLIGLWAPFIGSVGVCVYVCVLPRKSVLHNSCTNHWLPACQSNGCSSASEFPFSRWVKLTTKIAVPMTNVKSFLSTHP